MGCPSIPATGRPGAVGRYLSRKQRRFAAPAMEATVQTSRPSAWSLRIQERSPGHQVTGDNRAPEVARAGRSAASAIFWRSLDVVPLWCYNGTKDIQRYPWGKPARGKRERVASDASGDG